MNETLEWLRENFPTMLLSLFIALAVWFVAYREEIDQETYNSIPVEIVGQSGDVVITNNPTNTVTVSVNIPPDVEAASITRDIISATVDLSGLGPGSHSPPVQITIPNDRVLVAVVQPPQVNVVLEELAVREIPIQLNVEGDGPAVGYRIDTRNTIFSPETVIVEGPRSLVEQVSEVRFPLAIDDDQRNNITEMASLVALDSEGNPVEDITITPSEAEVTVPVQQEPGFKEVSVSVSTIGQQAEGYRILRIIPERDRVTIQGPPRVLEDIETINTETIDLTGLTETRTVTKRLDLPDGVTVEGDSELSVRVVIEPVVLSRTIENLPIQIRGDDSEFEVALSPQTVTVIINGPQILLDQIIEGQDIVAVIDVSDIEESGTYQLEPSIEFIDIESGDLEVTTITPTTITVDVSPAEEQQP